MKDRIAGILVVSIILLIFVIAMILVNNYYRKPLEYKYLTYENEWGYSNKCYKQDRFLVCIAENKLIRVRQFYYEK